MSFNINDLNKRSLDIFSRLVDTYVETGEPVGSRTLSRKLENPLSPATVRNIMSDLEESGLLYSPHTSAGRLPTEAGLRFFVNGLLEVGELSESDRSYISNMIGDKSVSVDGLLEKATSLLSDVSRCASLVMVPKSDVVLRHIEFVALSSDRALVVIISEDGMVENRLIDMPMGIDCSVLTEVNNYLNPKFSGKTLSQIMSLIENEIKAVKSSLDEMAAKLIRKGLAVWAGEENSGSLIVKGQSQLLDGVNEISELERIRKLFTVLDSKKYLHGLIDVSVKADGVQIFIGSESSLFKLSGCSMVVAPYQNANNKIIGAIGVVGPSRMNYSRIIPLVSYTAQVVGSLISKNLFEE